MIANRYTDLQHMWKLLLTHRSDYLGFNTYYAWRALSDAHQDKIRSNQGIAIKFGDRKSGWDWLQLWRIWTTSRTGSHLFLVCLRSPLRRLQGISTHSATVCSLYSSPWHLAPRCCLAAAHNSLCSPVSLPNPPMSSSKPPPPPILHSFVCTKTLEWTREARRVANGVQWQWKRQCAVCSAQLP